MSKERATGFQVIAFFTAKMVSGSVFPMRSWEGDSPNDLQLNEIICISMME